MIQKSSSETNGTPWLLALAYAVDLPLCHAIGSAWAIIMWLSLPTKPWGKIERLFRAFTPLTYSPHSYYPTPRRPADCLSSDGWSRVSVGGLLKIAHAQARPPRARWNGTARVESVNSQKNSILLSVSRSEMFVFASRWIWASKRVSLAGFLIISTYGNVVYT